MLLCPFSTQFYLLAVCIVACAYLLCVLSKLIPNWTELRKRKGDRDGCRGGKRNSQTKAKPRQMNCFYVSVWMLCVVVGPSSTTWKQSHFIAAAVRAHSTHFTNHSHTLTQPVFSWCFCYIFNRCLIVYSIVWFGIFMVCVCVCARVFGLCALFPFSFHIKCFFSTSICACVFKM